MEYSLIPVGIAEVWSPPPPKLWLVYIFSLFLAESRDERVSSFVTFHGALYSPLDWERLKTRI